MTKSQEKRQSSDTNQELTQMLELSYRHFKDFKGTIRTLLHEAEVKVNTPEKSGKKVLSRETEIIKKDQLEILDLKNKTSEFLKMFTGWSQYSLKVN